MSDEQRLIEIILSGLTREQLDDCVEELMDWVTENWPKFGPAVAARYSLESVVDETPRLSDDYCKALELLSRAHEIINHDNECHGCSKPESSHLEEALATFLRMHGHNV